MILFPLGFICGPIAWAGVACLIAGQYSAGLALVASSWALGIGIIYLAWRTDIGGRMNGNRAESAAAQNSIREA